MGLIPWTRTYRRQIPSRWSEIPRRKLHRVIKLIISDQLIRSQGKIVTDQRATSGALICLLLDLPMRAMRKIPANQFELLASTVNWMQFDTENTTPLVDYFEHEGEKYHGPSRDMLNCRALEYAIADEYYNSYLIDGKIADLYRLTATLYRTAKDDHDPVDQRQPLRSKAETMFFGESLTDLPEIYHIAALHFFSACKRKIGETYAQVFEATGSESISSGIDFGWYGVFMDVAESGIFGNLSQVQQSNIHTLLQYLLKKRIEYNEELSRRAFEKAAQKARAQG